MMKLAGKTLLEWQLAALRGASISEIGIVKGYLADKLKIADTTSFYNERWSETNMVATLTCADEWLTADTCVVSYADIVYPTETINKLKQVQGDIVVPYYTKWLTLWQKRFTNPLEDAETFQISSKGVLAEIGNRALSVNEIQGQYMGLLKFTPEGWKHVKNYLVRLSDYECARLDMTSLLRRLIENGTTIYTVAIDEPWYEVDNEHDLQLYEKLAQEFGGIFKVR
jgi:choline kinase